MILCQTPRLYLRPFTIEDLDFLYQLHSNPEVGKSTIDGVQNLETVKKHLDNFIGNQEKNGFSQWAVFENKTNKFVGRAGLIKRALNKEIGEQVEIRFAFMPEFWGQGIASEVTVALIQFAREKLKLQKLIAANGLTNEKSARVLIKHGFKHLKNIIPEGYGTADAIRYWELEL
ncbi:MAG: GNAT family N-acetyltransferase [Pseudomonadota bacterium]